MSITLNWFVVGAALAGVLAAISIWSPRSRKLKVAALAAAAMFFPATYASLTELLSRPKPLALEWEHRDITKATVLSADLQEGTGIYLWLRLPDTDEPRAYRLPWDEELAKELYGAQREAKTAGTDVRMKEPFDRSEDNDEAIFYAEPQAALPPKQVPDEKPLIVQARKPG